MSSTLPSLLYHVRRLVAPPETDSDADLLGRFSRLRDESAFAALVSRHGAMVFGVCRRVLRDPHAAEDASQATFMVLARKAGSIGSPDTLAAWLHGVAYRVAMKARWAFHRQRHFQSGQGLDCPDSRYDPLAEVSARELLEVLEGEVQGLPEGYRLPLVLCCLEGLSQEEASQRLGCTPASLRGRLERGRKRLHEQLARRGLALSTALAAVEASRGSAPAALAGSTVRVALAFAVGRGHGIIPQQVIALAERGLQTMFWSKVKIALILLAAVGLSGLGASWLASPLRRGEPPVRVSGGAAIAPAVPDPIPRPDDRVKNAKYFIFPVQTDLQRELAGKDTDLYVLLDAIAALEGGKIALSKLDLPGLQKALLRHKKAETKLHITLFFKETVPEERHNVLRYALMGFGHEIGFSKVTVFISYQPKETSWKEKTAPFTKKPRQPKGEERAIVSKLVKAYPVKTELSRYFTSDADCAMVILPSLEKDKGTIPQPVRDAIIEAVRKLKLVHKKRISFVTSHVGRDDQQPLLNAFYKFAEEMKFETSVVSFR